MLMEARLAIESILRASDMGNFVQLGSVDAIGELSWIDPTFKCYFGAFANI